MRTKLREYILRSCRTSGMLTYDAKNGSVNMSGFGTSRRVKALAVESGRK